MKFKGVVFDMDGTLVDTEPMYTICMRDTIETLGFPCTEEYINSLRGMPNLAIQQKCVRVFGDTFDCKKYDKLVFSLADEYIAAEGVPLKKGVIELLDYLKSQNIAYAIATSSTKEIARKMLTAAGINRYFEHIVSGDMVTHGKPAPDIFLKAAEILGLPPEECIAVEDSNNGLRAATASGMHTVYVPDLTVIEPAVMDNIQYHAPDLLDVILHIDQLNGKD